MKIYLPDTYNELKIHEKKMTHWAWYAWPTTYKGNSEPLPKTSISYKNAKLLLDNYLLPWKKTLILSCKLILKKIQ